MELIKDFNMWEEIGKKFLVILCMKNCLVNFKVLIDDINDFFNENGIFSGEISLW